ncbi:MAG: lipase family protein [Candidatus Thiodiazotropha sp.]
MPCVTDIREVNAEQIELLIDCSIQAYNAFSSNAPSHCHASRVTPPEGYELVDDWSGVDAVFGGHKKVETYGLAFRSLAAPWRYIFAFRGTDSALDMLDDCGLEPQSFVPFDSTRELAADLRVESGFYDIYKCGDAGTVPMRRQLFALIDKYQASTRPIAEILVTGHSLGAALSQIFTLDLALSRQPIPGININFASPRVGNSCFVALFQQVVNQPTLRVQNSYDAVPRLPPAELGFEHIPSVYMVAFYSNDMFGKIDLTACHSSINYRAVISCAGASQAGVCIAKRLPVDGNGSICSERPDIEG